MATMKEIQQYQAALKRADHQSKEQFYQLFSLGMELLSLLDRDISREFSVSRTTIFRWREGRNAPHPLMRGPVYTFLSKRASRLMQQKRRSRQSGSVRVQPIPMVAKDSD